MKVPLSWLKDFVDVKADVKEFSEAMTMTGSKIESIEIKGQDISNVVVGKIVSLEKHPDADKLQVARVDVGKEVVQIVTGAWNIKMGDYIPVALHGSTLPGNIRIKKTRLRGVESNGMMCSINELNLDKEDYPEASQDGIFVLDGEPTVGMDIKDALGLNETVVEFEITSNRPDCLNILGIAREAAAAFKTELRKPVIKLNEEADDANKYASVQIIDPDLCPRYAARIIKDVKVGPSPKWMRDRLKSAGVRPINNIVDITNYVMLELGQPMHAFDLNLLEDRKIVVRRALDGEVIKTLDDQERRLDSSMLVIADSTKPVAVAGVMGGLNSEINEHTKTILFESANFYGISVRLTAKKLGIRTEASARFEKGLDAENVVIALDRAAQLVEELGAGKVCKGVIDCYPKKQEQRTVKFRPDKINAFLGTSIDKNLMIDILKSLEFKVDETNMTIIVPSFRQDVENEADISEEIARFYGYNNIEATLLDGKNTTIGQKTIKQKIEDIIKNTMLSCGLSETYTYSFTNPKVFDRLRLLPGSELRKAVSIINPLGEDYSIMRTTTIPDMLSVISRNYNRQVEEAGFFELSYVYLPKSLQVTELPDEKPVLTIGMYGNVDFYDLKGILEELMRLLGITNCEFDPLKDHPSFHPGRTAMLMLDGKQIGVIGQIHPDVANEFECPEVTYIGVVETMPLVENASLMPQYKPLPRFPAVARDIAIVVRDDILAKQVEEVIKKESGNILEDIKLFDVYKGKQVPGGMKSMAYSITFRSGDRTLTDEEVNRTMKKIIDGLGKTVNAQLRE